MRQRQSQHSRRSYSAWVPIQYHVIVSPSSKPNARPNYPCVSAGRPAQPATLASPAAAPPSARCPTGVFSADVAGTVEGQGSRLRSRPSSRDRPGTQGSRGCGDIGVIRWPLGVRVVLAEIEASPDAFFHFGWVNVLPATDVNSEKILNFVRRRTNCSDLFCKD